MAAINYGITYTQNAIDALLSKEKTMLDECGFGYDICSKEMVALRKHERNLIQFKHERDNGLKPSYNPSIHGGVE